ncbi:CGNR zinc finger domain-containing protein [Streptomyces xiamenensis]|jgi:predicted RNA-binding Zn ribbon-like protein|uniref:CGNR zinc finger domain-containing protein n=1 Tax=Streptomyces xiamenensis TaxID=408015 RepID=UPI0036E2D5F0
MKVSFSDYAAGAGLATDLVNTSPLVWKSAGEMLGDPAELADFLNEHGIDHPTPTPADLRQVHHLRDDLRAVLEAGTEDATAAGANALLTRATTAPVLERDAGREWQWYVATDPATPLADRLAVLTGTGLLGTLRTLGHTRFRPCASPTCDGLFVDTSRAGRRRYCMPELCGNRANVARHRARSRRKAESARGHR